MAISHTQVTGGTYLAALDSSTNVLGLTQRVISSESSLWIHKDQMNFFVLFQTSRNLLCLLLFISCSCDLYENSWIYLGAKTKTFKENSVTVFRSLPMLLLLLRRLNGGKTEAAANPKATVWRYQLQSYFTVAVLHTGQEGETFQMNGSEKNTILRSGDAILWTCDKYLILQANREKFATWSHPPAAPPRRRRHPLLPQCSRQRCLRTDTHFLHSRTIVCQKECTFW